VQDLLSAVLRFAKGAHTYMTSTWVEPWMRPAVCQMVLNNWMLNAPSYHIVNYLLAREESGRWRGVLRGLQFASFHAQFREVKLPDGRVERVTQYPRVVVMTLFDARLLDATSEPEDSQPSGETAVPGPPPANGLVEADARE
jgi:hypothetical protein